MVEYEFCCSLSKRKPSWWTRRRSFEAEGLQEFGPGGKDQVTGDGGEVTEKASARRKLRPNASPEFVVEIAGGMKGEGEQVQGGENTG